jgi:hypothetical protein
MKKLLFLGLFLLVTCNAYAMRTGNLEVAGNISLDGHLTAAGQIWSGGSLVVKGFGAPQLTDTNIVGGTGATFAFGVTYQVIKPCVVIAWGERNADGLLSVKLTAASNQALNQDVSEMVNSAMRSGTNINLSAIIIVPKDYYFAASGTGDTNRSIYLIPLS